VATKQPPFSAGTVEMVCRALAEACTGGQIAQLIAPLRPSASPDDRDTKWKRLYNAVAEAQNRQGDGMPLVRLVIDVMDPVRFASPQQFAAVQASVNERLLLSGLRVTDTGQVARTKAAVTLSEAQQRADDLRAELTRRGVHADVLHFCRAELLADNYFHAVLEAAKSVADKLRTLTCLSGDGARLVDDACTLATGTPKVAFNALGSEWERSEHTGVATLLKGLFATYRNPAAHAPRVQWATTRADALDMLTIASMLHRRLDAATVRP